MERLIEREQWPAFFKEFDDNNCQRPTRLEVLDDSGTQPEEHGLPFAGLDLDTRGASAPYIEIFFEGEGADKRRVSHTIPRARQVRVKVGKDGRDEVLAIESEENTKTLLHFETPAEIER